MSPITIIINFNTSQSPLGGSLFRLFKECFSRTGLTSLHAVGSLVFLFWRLILSIYPSWIDGQKVFSELSWPPAGLYRQASHLCSSLPVQTHPGHLSVPGHRCDPAGERV